MLWIKRELVNGKFRYTIPEKKLLFLIVVALIIINLLLFAIEKMNNSPGRNGPEKQSVILRVP